MRELMSWQLSAVTFGVRPERPATEYGYINPGEVVAGGCGWSRSSS